MLYFAGATTHSADTSTHEAPSGRYGRLPLAFEANHGQTDGQVQFLARASGYQLFLTRGDAVLAFRASATESRASGGVPAKTQLAQPTGDMKQAVVRMALEGANPDPHVMGLEQLPGKVNYLRGNDPDEWQTNVPAYAKVRYEAVYAGIDLVYYGHGRQLEYDFIVAPGADPHAITLSFEGADSMYLDAGGALVLTTAAGPVRFHKPLVYQETDGRRQSVAGEYVRKGTGRMGFRVGGYDIARALVIDPVLSYSTYLGGSALDAGVDIAVDGTGAAYVTGLTQSLDFPTRVPVQSTLNNGVDAFVAKLSPDGSGLVYATYLGGGNSDQGSNIAVDATGAAYIVGLTQSRDFPIQSAVQPTLAGEDDGFVAKLTPDGTALIYATYLGGEDSDLARDIAVDAGGSAYVTGQTCSSNFPTKSPLQPTLHGPCDAVIVKLAPDGVLVYSTYLGGSALEDGVGIAIDITGAAFVAGWTTSEDFPTRFPLQSLLNGGAASGQDEIGDAFIAKLAPDGTALLYATYLGGTGGDAAMSMAVDSAGAAYILGETQSEDFPTESPLQPRPARAASFRQTLSLFVAKLTADGSALASSTYFGGTGTNATDIAVDPTGAAYVTGWVPGGFNFIVVHPIKPDRSETAVKEGFIAKFAPDGSGLLYSVTLDNGDFMARPMALRSMPPAPLTSQVTPRR